MLRANGCQVARDLRPFRFRRLREPLAYAPASGIDA
jgi:hypothetical protein